jgi:starch synthase
MSVLLVASECTPFAQVGGLGDVAAALPVALSGHGHRVALVLPLYRCIDRAA